MWLKILAECVDEDVAVLPDDSIVFPVKAVLAPSDAFSSCKYDASLLVSALGLTLLPRSTEKSLNSVASQGLFCSYLDINKWELIVRNGKLEFRCSIYDSGPGSKLMDFVFRTPEAVKLSTCIEFYIEKLSCFIHIQSECATTNPGCEGWDNVSINDSSIVSSIYGAAAEAPVLKLPSSADSVPRLGLMQRQRHAVWLRECLQRKAGLLYNDGVIEVSASVIVSHLRGALTVSLIFKNRSSMCIVSLFSRLEDCPKSLKGTYNPDETTVAELLDSDESCQQDVTFICSGPFSAPPKLRISYRRAAGTIGTELISLPVIMASFTEPWVMTGAEFRSRWAPLAREGEFELTDAFLPQHKLGVLSVAYTLATVYS